MKKRMLNMLLALTLAAGMTGAYAQETPATPTDASPEVAEEAAMATATNLAAADYDGVWLDADSGGQGYFLIYLPVDWTENEISGTDEEAGMYFSATDGAVTLTASWLITDEDWDVEKLLAHYTEKDVAAGIVTFHGVDYVYAMEVGGADLELLAPGKGGIHRICFTPVTDEAYRAMAEKVLPTISMTLPESEEEAVSPNG